MWISKVTLSNLEHDIAQLRSSDCYVRQDFNALQMQISGQEKEIAQLKQTQTMILDRLKLEVKTLPSVTKLVNKE